MYNIFIAFELTLYSYLWDLHVKDEGIVFSTRGIEIGPADLVAA